MPIRDLNGVARYEKNIDSMGNEVSSLEYDDKYNLLSRKCIVGFYTSDPLEEKELYHNAYILVGLGEWQYECGSTIEEISRMLDDFTNEFEGMNGVAEVYYEQYNETTRRFELHRSEFERGKMGMRITEYGITEDEYEQIKRAMKESATYKSLMRTWE